MVASRPLWNKQKTWDSEGSNAGNIQIVVAVSRPGQPPG
jgi:hypothetical protein